jgi:hypothetical protein
MPKHEVIRPVLKPRPRTYRRALLSTDNAQDFEQLLDETALSFSPVNAFERNLVNDMAGARFDGERFQRALTACIQREMPGAVANLIVQYARDKEEWEVDTEEDAAAIGIQWQDDPAMRKRIDDFLAQFGLDNAAIEAEATRLVANEVVFFHRLLHMAREQEQSAMQSLFLHREGMARHQRRIAGAENAANANHIR